MRACPACGEELLPIGPVDDGAGYRENLRWHVIGCQGCGGVWTDNTASQRVVSSIDPDIIAAAAEAEGLAAKHGAPLPDDTKARVCPECGGALARVRTVGTTLDACSKHGTWFDRGELRKVAHALEHARKLRDPTWKSSEDMRWVAGKTALNEGKPLEPAAADDDDLLVEAITWAARQAARRLKSRH
jgi:Zn-finger nucleic acid-binding protein